MKLATLELATSEPLVPVPCANNKPLVVMNILFDNNVKLVKCFEDCSRRERTARREAIDDFHAGEKLEM